MNVLGRALTDHRRSLVGWSVGAVLLVLMTVAFYPTIRDQPSIVELARDLPEAVKATFGIDDSVSLASPQGYLHGRMFSLAMPLALVIFAISAGARAIGGAEEAGDLELLLAQPVTRQRVLLERYASLVLLTVALGSVFTVALFGLAPLFGAIAGLSPVRLLGAASGAVALAVLHGTIAFAAGAARGTRSSGVVAGAGAAVAGYLLQGLLAAASAPDGLRYVSPWHWYLRRNMLAEGVDPLAFGLPFACIAALVALSLATFRSRDLR